MRLPHDTRSTVRQLAPADVRELLADAPDGDILLLDVREPWEYDIAHIPGSMLIPLALLPLKFRDLNAKAPTIVLCHHGMEPVSVCSVSRVAATKRSPARRGVKPIAGTTGKRRNTDGGVLRRNPKGRGGFRPGRCHSSLIWNDQTTLLVSCPERNPPPSRPRSMPGQVPELARRLLT